MGLPATYRREIWHVSERSLSDGKNDRSAQEVAVSGLITVVEVAVPVWLGAGYVGGTALSFAAPTPDNYGVRDRC